MPKKRLHTPVTAIATPPTTVLPVGEIDPTVLARAVPRHVLPGTPDEARSALGISLDCHLVVLTLKAPYIPPFTWEKFTWEITGTHPEPADVTYGPSLVCDILWKQCRLPWVFVWCRRVFHEDTPAFVEWRWTPEGDAGAIQGLAALPPKASVAKTLALMRQALRLLRAMQEAGGRPRGTRKIPREEFKQLLFDTYQQQWDDFGSRPRLKEVAEALDLHPNTLRTYLRDGGLSFPPFLKKVRGTELFQFFPLVGLRPLLPSAHTGVFETSRWVALSLREERQYARPGSITAQNVATALPHRTSGASATTLSAGVARVASDRSAYRTGG